MREALLNYWTQGGMLMPVLFVISCGIWFTFFSIRSRLIHLPTNEDSEDLLTHIVRDRIVLNALTAAAPLLGLLGTVMGMIATFQAVFDTAGDTATAVSSGISQALLTTQLGLVVAIPGLFGLARIDRLTQHARARIGAWRVEDAMGKAA